MTLKSALLLIMKIFDILHNTTYLLNLPMKGQKFKV